MKAKSKPKARIDLSLFVAKALRAMRGEKSQGDLATQCGVGRITIMRLEGSNGNARLSSLEKIANGLNVKVSDIIKRAEQLREAGKR